jgi:hypothetical protein
LKEKTALVKDSDVKEEKASSGTTQVKGDKKTEVTKKEELKSESVTTTPSSAVEVSAAKPSDEVPAVPDSTLPPSEVTKHTPTSSEAPTDSTSAAVSESTPFTDPSSHPNPTPTPESTTRQTRPKIAPEVQAILKKQFDTGEKGETGQDEGEKKGEKVDTILDELMGLARSLDSVRGKVKDAPRIARAQQGD